MFEACPPFAAPTMTSLLEDEKPYRGKSTAISAVPLSLTSSQLSSSV